MKPSKKLLQKTKPNMAKKTPVHTAPPPESSSSEEEEFSDSEHEEECEEENNGSNLVVEDQSDEDEQLESDSEEEDIENERDVKKELQSNEDSEGEGDDEGDDEERDNEELQSGEEDSEREGEMQEESEEEDAPPVASSMVSSKQKLHEAESFKEKTLGKQKLKRIQDLKERRTKRQQLFERQKKIKIKKQLAAMKLDINVLHAAKSLSSELKTNNDLSDENNEDRDSGIEGGIQTYLGRKTHFVEEEDLADMFKKRGLHVASLTQKSNFNMAKAMEFKEAMLRGKGVKRRTVAEHKSMTQKVEAGKLAKKQRLKI